MIITGHDIDILARTIYGEARGEPLEGQIAVAWVVRNRATLADHRRQFGIGTLASACQAPWQFSCWNENDPNRQKLFAVDLNDPIFRRCYFAALGVVDVDYGFAYDPTHGALFYYADTIDPPSWAVGKPYIQIGHHRFIKDA